MFAAPGPAAAPLPGNAKDYPLWRYVNLWLSKLKLALDYKNVNFQEDADELLKLYHGPYDFLYDPAKYTAIRSAFAFRPNRDEAAPSFRITYNKVAEAVQIFGPHLYHKNPYRQVNAREPVRIGLDDLDPYAVQDPNIMQAYQYSMARLDQQAGISRTRAQVLEAYLNYTPEALDLKTESRLAINEALIKGMGCLWTELYQPPGGGPLMVGSFYDSVDNLVIDPDMESLATAKWIARRYIEPVWQVEATYGLPQGSLRGNLSSIGNTSAVSTDPNGNYLQKAGLTNDLLVYWRIYSKMGFGSLLSGGDSKLAGQLEPFGDYVHLVVSDSVNYFLNLPPQLTSAYGPGELADRARWPTPFWADGGWPVTPIYFHTVPRQVWPMSHLKPAMGELKFLNWAYSFLAGKIKSTCRDFIAVLKSAGEELERVLVNGSDLELIKIDAAHGNIRDLVQFLQHPNFNGDIWKVIEAIERKFEERVGLTEIMYGYTDMQMRSASEANLKGDQVMARPEDMANKVEEQMTLLARREALAARWHLQGHDVEAVLGDFGSMLWDSMIGSSQPADIIHGLQYRIEAGSVRRPNRQRDAANMNQAMQTLFQPLFSFALQSGNVQPVNELIKQWAKTMDLDASRFLLPPPPPPQQLPGGPGPEPGQGPPPQGPQGPPPPQGEPHGRAA